MKHKELEILSPARDNGSETDNMALEGAQYFKRDFWAKENLKYVQPHFRMQKAANLVNSVAKSKPSDFLDLGCGPATLEHLLRRNIHYHGIDIAIQKPAPNLLQADFLETPINFGGKKFDLVLAQGVFEYVGRHQSEKFSEIRNILNPHGIFIVSYVNFGHLNKQVYWPYNNIQPQRDFRRSLTRFFRIQRVVPTSHRWRHDEPRSRPMKAVQMRINLNIPLLSQLFAVEYFFICSAAD